MGARAAYGRMDADTAGRAIIDRKKPPLLTRAQESGRHMRPPHLVDGAWDDCPVVSTRSMGRTKARFGAGTVLAHQS